MAALSGLARETRQEPATHPPRPGREAMDWRDVRVFLAIAREGSMRAAGRALGLSQPTIARRLAAFETSFGGQILFDGAAQSVGDAKIRQDEHSRGGCHGAGNRETEARYSVS
jgi:hypothetical protein